MRAPGAAPRSVAVARVLHVAALPFPSPQGTQAALRSMLHALAQDGRAHHLLAYAHGGDDAELSFPLHRAVEPVPYRSLRSGPSAHKLLADGALGLSLLRLLRTLQPALVVAHHVEAGALSVLASALSGRPLVFFAHTDLGAELPTYAPRLPSRWLGGAGSRLDAALVRRAHAVAAISPLLAARLRENAGADAGKVHELVPPWPLPAPIGRTERAECRAALGLSPDARVLLYAGNLDAYQGWDEALAALPAIRKQVPQLVWLVATESDPTQLLAAARRAGLAGIVQVRRLDGERVRRAWHAAADAAIVPRRSPGGLPIKLLDAMARGVPCVVARAAAAGLPLADAVELAAGNDAGALAAAALLAFARPAAERDRRARRARAYVAERHGHAPFLHAFDRICEHALQRAFAPASRPRAQVF